jgi:hypothetical protein
MSCCGVSSISDVAGAGRDAATKARRHSILAVRTVAFEEGAPDAQRWRRRRGRRRRRRRLAASVAISMAIAIAITPQVVIDGEGGGTG